jgi:hypothetical protein
MFFKWPCQNLLLPVNTTLMCKILWAWVLNFRFGFARR